MRTAIAAAEGPHSEKLGEWLARGFTLSQAREWIADGVDLSEAVEWRAIGADDAGVALRWRVRGFRPGEARLFGQLGVRRRARRVVRRLPSPPAWT